MIVLQFQWLIHHMDTFCLAGHLTKVSFSAPYIFRCRILVGFLLFEGVNPNLKKKIVYRLKCTQLFNNNFEVLFVSKNTNLPSTIFFTLLSSIQWHMEFYKQVLFCIDWKEVTYIRKNLLLLKLDCRKIKLTFYFYGILFIFNWFYNFNMFTIVV